MFTETPPLGILAAAPELDGLIAVVLSPVSVTVLTLVTLISVVFSGDKSMYSGVVGVEFVSFSDGASVELDMVATNSVETFSVNMSIELEEVALISVLFIELIVAFTVFVPFLDVTSKELKVAFTKFVVFSNGTSLGFKVAFTASAVFSDGTSIELEAAFTTFEVFSNGTSVKLEAVVLSDEKSMEPEVEAIPFVVS